jgi:2,4-dienoyl-CoA reductase-like NADH-dependent reductase (Old Yellow Enzyme family)
MPLLMRISAVEYAEGGYGLDHAIELCRKYRDAGVDLFDVSSGGESPTGAKPYPGYQVPFARAVREKVGVPVIAVGLLDDPVLAEHVVASGAADLVAVGRGMLRNPYWAIDALRALGDKAPVAEAYVRGY